MFENDNNFFNDNISEYLSAVNRVAYRIHEANALWCAQPAVGEPQSRIVEQILNANRPKIGGFVASFNGFCPQCLLDRRLVLIRQAGSDSGECPECHLVLEFNCPNVWLQPRRGKFALQNQDRPAMWLLSAVIRDCFILKSSDKEENDHTICTEEELRSIIAKID